MIQRSSRKKWMLLKCMSCMNMQRTHCVPFINCPEPEYMYTSYFLYQEYGGISVVWFACGVWSSDRSFTIICLISANFEEFSKPLTEVLLKFGIVSCKETTKASKNDREYLKQFKRLTFDIFFKPILPLYASPIVSLASSLLLVRIFWLTVWPISSWFLLSPRTSSQQAHHSHILSSAQAQHHPDYIQFNIKETRACLHHLRCAYHLEDAHACISCQNNVLVLFSSLPQR